jgi:Secretion system C-terminal sorting domain/Bacterial Ig domain
MKVQILSTIIFILLLSIPQLYTAMENNTTREAAVCLPKQSITDDLLVEVLGGDITPQTMLEALVGTNTSVAIHNVQYTGANIASGIFSGARLEGLAIDSGVILSSGYAENIYGPNVSQGITGMNNVPGSSNLDGLIPGYFTNDASIFEFDFVPKFNSIGFTYIFGSDEYLEYVGTNYNDVFGLFIDGDNIAIIPGTGVAVSINNVNNVSYSQFYTDNPPGSNNFNVEPDGMTIAVSVSRLIEPDVSHHISFEVADAGDFVFDSWVFLEAGSFHSAQCSTYFNVIVVDGLELECYEDEDLEIEVIAIGEDEANFSWTIHPPMNGTAEFISNDLIEQTRIILYTPDEDFNGVDSFVLTVTDGLGGIINRFIEIEVLPVKDAPVCTQFPIIYGDFDLDNTVNCDPGTWNDDIDNQYAPPGGQSTISLNYQWQRAYNSVNEWVNIENENSDSYTISEDDMQHYLRCLVIAIDNGIGVGDDNSTIEESNYEYCGPVGTEEDLILSIGFTGIYPNPFNPSTTISFNILENSNVELEIFNIKGQLIQNLIYQEMNSGRKSIVWNGTDQSGNGCPTGFYLAKLKINEHQFVRKLMLMK